MLTYGALILEISSPLRDPIPTLSCQYRVRPIDVEAALELLVRRRIARRLRLEDPETGSERTLWLLNPPTTTEALAKAEEQGIDVAGPILDRFEPRP